MNITLLIKRIIKLKGSSNHRNLQQLLRESETQFGLCHDLMNCDIPSEARVKPVRDLVRVGTEMLHHGAVRRQLQFHPQSRREGLGPPVGEGSLGGHRSSLGAVQFRHMLGTGAMVTRLQTPSVQCEESHCAALPTC